MTIPWFKLNAAQKEVDYGYGKKKICHENEEKKESSQTKGKNQEEDRCCR